MMSYDRRWLDEPHGGDHLGRAAWALGEVIGAQPTARGGRPEPAAAGAMATALAGPMSPRGTWASRCSAWPGRPRSAPRRPAPAAPDAGRPAAAAVPHRRAPTTGAGSRSDLTYDNARLPQALIAAGTGSATTPMLAAGLEALDWYGAQCALSAPVVRLVGNGWRRAGQHRSARSTATSSRSTPPPWWRPAPTRWPPPGTASTASGRCGRSSGSSAATGWASRSTTSPPAAATTASAPTA